MPSVYYKYGELTLYRYEEQEGRKPTATVDVL